MKMKPIAHTLLALSVLAVASPAIAAPSPAKAPINRAQADTIPMLSGRFQVFSTAEPLSRVAISNPKIADVRVVSPTQILVQGKQPGTTTLLVWHKKGGTKAYEVQVGLDATEVQRQIQRVTGNDDLHVAFNGQAFLLSGQATIASQIQAAEKIAASYGQPVVNLVQMPARRDQIAIDVYVVELSKSAALNFGWTPGGGEVTGIENGIRKYIFKPGQMMMGEAVTGQIQSFAQIDFLAARIDLLQKRGEAKLLARPTLVTTDGGNASFLAGGEFPVPIPQALGVTTIQFKEFGVRLGVQPTLTNDGRINMKVKPEVSSLDFANGLKLQNFAIPALRTRRADTEVTLAPNETLMLGGLMNNEKNHTWDQIPFIGDIPIIGELFKSRAWLDSTTELAIFVSPRLIGPSTDQKLPESLSRVRQDLSQEMGR